MFNLFMILLSLIWIKRACIESYGVSCSNGWIQKGSYCYWFNKNKKGVNGVNWYNSLLACQQYGANLLSIENEAENSFINEQLQNEMEQEYWIGLNISSVRKFAWSDHINSEFTNWRSGEPNNANNDNEACVLATKDGWVDNTCDTNNEYICKNGIDNNTGKCTNNWLKYENYCYLFNSDYKKNWYNSLKSCQPFGNLLNVKDEAENSFIVKNLQENKNYWIGFSYYPMERKFRWSDNTTFNFTNWNNGEPNDWSNTNEACVHARYPGWNDSPCNGILGFICKIKLDIWSEWNNWSDCSLSCGNRFRNRTRVCPNSQDCPGKGYDQQLCSNWTKCKEEHTQTQSMSLQSSVSLSPYQTTQVFSRILMEALPLSHFEEYTQTKSTSLKTLVLSSQYQTMQVFSRTIMEALLNASAFDEYTQAKSTILKNSISSTPYQTRQVFCRNSMEALTVSAFEEYTQTKTLKTLVSSSIYQTVQAFNRIVIKEWSTWSECSVTCGNGNQNRHSLNAVSNMATQVKNCHDINCPVDGMWSNWTVSECSASCGGGKIFFNRSCDNPPPKYNGCYCLGISNYDEFCSNDIICPENGGWSEWSTWSLCNQPCNNGFKTRLRDCSNPIPKYGGVFCNGDSIQTEECLLESCKEINLNLFVYLPDETYDDTYTDLTLSLFISLKVKIENEVDDLYKTYKRNVSFSIFVHSIKDGGVVSHANG